MKDKNVIEICVGVGMNQIFPETIRLNLGEETTLNPINEDEDERDYSTYIYY